MQILTNQSNNILYLTIQDPKHKNALGLEIGQLLLEKLSRVNANKEDIRLVVITAGSITAKSGEKIWIAGGNLKDLATLNSEQARSYVELYVKIAQKIKQIEVPVIALVDGAAIGGGAELALWCDLRVMTAGSSFSFKQTKLGLATGYGSCHHLVSLIGLARAQDLLLRARKINAKETFDIGLCSLILDETLPAKNRDLEQFFDEIASNSFYGLAAQKKMLRLQFDASIVSKELDIFENTWMNHDHTLFLENFFNKKNKLT
jgi:methylglutaconyl-CoA hydratase